MHGGPGRFVIIILVILFAIDIYAFRGLRHVAVSWNNQLKIFLTVVYWLVPVFIAIMSYLIMSRMGEMASGTMYYRTFYTFMGVLVLFYAPKLIFSAFELGNDLVNGFMFLTNKVNISAFQSKFQLLRYAGFFAALLLFVLTFYGILHGRYHYKINHRQLAFSDLPESFNNFKIIHISDWHIGSYYGRPERIDEAVARINSLKPDLILFTGDLVNNLSAEVDEFLPALKKLEAKYGKYSVLGNHDYGDYVQWKSQDERAKNLERLKQLEAEIGFNLLNNQNVPLQINGQQIVLIGVENWGLPPFPQHGNLKKAFADTTNYPFKILMSHDPSHWDAEVRKQTDIDLTLSGHTHGMQFGFILKNLKWSPVKLKYPRWAGLYQENGQMLYVNVGIGYIGFPGRVGIRPEIAVLELVRKED